MTTVKRAYALLALAFAFSTGMARSLRKRITSA